VSAPTGYLVALRTAVVAKLNEDPYFAAYVPQGVTYRPTRVPIQLPAVTFWDIGTRSDNVVPLHDRTWHFDVWATDLDTCEAIAAVVNGLLDNQGLPLHPDSDPYSEDDTTEGLVAYLNLRGDEDQPMNDADVVRKMLTYRMLVYDYTGPEPFQK